MAARPPKSRLDNFSKWEELSDTSDTQVTFSEFNVHANTYPESDECPFRRPREDYRKISTDRETAEWTYFYAQSPGLQVNVPIPLHPGLTQTVFYTHLAYLLQVCKPFSHADGLGGLTQSSLDASYLARGPLVPRIRRALGGGRSVVVRECSTRFDGVPIEVPDERFSQLVKPANAAVEAQDLVRWPKTITIDLAVFWEHRPNPKCILNLLDLNCHLHAGRPAWMGGLYDDPAARRTVLATSSYAIADLIRYPQWQLLGHPFSFTPTHQDSTGVSTYVTVVRGRKLWFLLQWTVPVVTPALLG